MQAGEEHLTTTTYARRSLAECNAALGAESHGVTWAFDHELCLDAEGTNSISCCNGRCQWTRFNGHDSVAREPRCLPGQDPFSVDDHGFPDATCVPNGRPCDTAACCSG